MQDIATRMPEASRVEMFRELPTEWVLERDIIAWCFATWEGPANRDRLRYTEFIQRQTDLGFGRIRRFLISIASPGMLLQKAGDLWKQDHTHGDLKVDMEPKKATLTLRDHPYTETPQSRATIAEVFRYTISLTRTAVFETHKLQEPGVIVVSLRW